MTQLNEADGTRAQLRRLYSGNDLAFIELEAITRFCRYTHELSTAAAYRWPLGSAKE